MKRRYRLRKNADFQQVRRRGQSKSNRIIVLIALPNNLNHSRFGFAVNKRVGKAVKRNKIKRQMREAARLRIAQIQAGWDFVFIARGPIVEASYQQIDEAIKSLLKKIKVYQEIEK
ncbi:MAG: ribonuclease P protein component [Chloroflexota bacterium]